MKNTAKILIRTRLYESFQKTVSVCMIKMFLPWRSVARVGLLNAKFNTAPIQLAVVDVRTVV